jgi:proteasome assembly chaperone (PAC2) family protein
MTEMPKLKDPWMVAVWPGMGHVAISAGYYLMAKLGMHLLAEFSADELADINHVDVKGGLISSERLPRDRLFSWTDPNGKHDIVVFIGEAQPSIGKHRFCTKLIEFASTLGVQRVFTFAAMATHMRPDDPSRVFCAATDREGLEELQEAKLHTLEDGNIGGLNGLLVGTAADHGLPGACLLGEIPHVFAQLPYPKASLGVLRAFTKLADIELDLGELTQQAESADHQLGALFSKMEAALSQQENEVETYQSESYEEDRLSDDDQQRIERLFKIASEDRSRAYELKQDLDRLGVFAEYEDRFLDLFKRDD